MPLPVDYQTCQVTGEWFDPSTGEPGYGSVLFTPRATRITTDSDVIVLPNPIEVWLKDGKIDVAIPATDDPNVQPVGWTYRVTESVSGFKAAQYDLEAPAEGAVDLSDVVGTVGSSGTIMGGGVSEDDLASVAFSGSYDDLTDKPTLGGGGVQLGDLAAVATSGDYDDLSNKPAIPSTPGDIGAATSAQGSLADTAVQPGDLAAVATSGDYDDLSGRPAIPSVPADVGAASAAQGDLADTAVQPTDLASVATSGDYDDLSNKPAIPSTPGDIGAATSAQGGLADTAVQPGDLSTVATTGSYDDLDDKPSIPSTPGDIGAATSAQGGLADTAVQPGDLSSVATSGSYNDLDDKPTLGTAAASDAGDFASAAQGGLADTAVQPGDLSTVATTGSYDDLSDKPTIPSSAAEITADPSAWGGAATDTQGALDEIVTGVGSALNDLANDLANNSGAALSTAGQAFAPTQQWTVGAATVAVPHADRISADLDMWPDGTIGFATISGTTYGFASNSANNARWTATPGDLLGAVQQTSQPLVTIEDADYAAGGPIIHIGTKLVKVWHGEEHGTYTGYPESFTAFLGLAVADESSPDTWTDLGRIITPEIDWTTEDVSADIGGGGCCVVDGYLYVFFADTLANSTRVPMAVARCSIADLTTWIGGGAAATFNKFHLGDWDEPGIGGVSSNVLPGIVWPAWVDAITLTSHDDRVLLAWMGKLDSFGGDTDDWWGVWTALSEPGDPTRWGRPEVLVPASRRFVAYPTLAKPDLSATMATTGDTVTLYTVESDLPPDGGFRWDDAEVVQRTLTWSRGTVDLVAHPDMIEGTAYRLSDPVMDGWWEALDPTTTGLKYVVVVGDSFASSALGPFPWPLERHLLGFSGVKGIPAGWQFGRLSAASSSIYGFGGDGTQNTDATGSYGRTMAVGQKATATAVCDGVTIFYRTSPGAGDLIVRDGVGGTVLTTIDTDAAAGLNSWSSGALSLTSRTIEVEASGGTVVLDGGYLSNGNRVNGVRVVSASMSGITSKGMAENPVLALDMIEHLHAAGELACVVTATGTNDGPATGYQGQLIDAIQAVAPGAPVVTWVPPLNGVTSASEHASMLAEITARGVPLIDGARLGRIDGGDNVHPDAAGQRMIADQIATVLSGDPIGSQSRIRSLPQSTVEVPQVIRFRESDYTYMISPAEGVVQVNTQMALLLGVIDGTLAAQKFRPSPSSTLPAGPNVAGEICLHDGVHKICTIPGSPGTWVPLQVASVGAWQTQTLINSWTAPYDPLQVRHVGLNEVQVQASVLTGGISGDPYCQLPVGYRPSTLQTFMAFFSTDGTDLFGGSVNVTTDGYVTPYFSSGAGSLTLNFRFFL